MVELILYLEIFLSQVLAFPLSSVTKLIDQGLDSSCV